MSGWFAVKRGITSHPIFKGHPDRLAVWMWLLDNACWQDTPHDIRGKTITVKRGQVCASERRIAEEVGVGRQVIRSLFKRLQAEHMVNPDPTHGRSVITLCNYEKYQDPKPKANPAPNPKLTQEQPIKEQINNIPVGEAADAAPADPAKLIFDAGVKMLTASGKSDSQARGILGRWRKLHGEAQLIEALGKAQREGAIDPVSYIEGVFRFKSRQQATAPVEKPGTVHMGAFGRAKEIC